VSAHPLPGVFAALAPLLNHYGYLAIAALLFLENLGVPVVPGETILIAGAIYAGAGRLNIVGVGVIALVAAVAGSGCGYAIGHFGGRALVLRYGRYVFLTGERLDKAERFFTRHGGVVVTIARFLEGLRQANGIIAGITHMRWSRFLAFSTLGGVAWVAVWASVGYLAGDHITTIYQQVTRYSLYVLIVLAVAVAALVARYLIRRRHAASPAEADQRPG
jgi:membrane protein DedA with SNARE-associated domain